MNSGIWASSTPSVNGPLRVPAVDGHPAAAQAGAFALAFAGREARYAFDGDSAFQCIALWTPDRALLDTNMPSRDGLPLAALAHVRVAPFWPAHRLPLSSERIPQL
jgi:CheY-like chemotaxis protein